MRRGLALLLFLAVGFLAGCGDAIDWNATHEGMEAVRQALDEGDYAKAKALWKPVDQVIHAVYPTLQKKNGPLARDMWHHMALVELGFMSGDWEKARQGAEALPSILKKVEAELGGMSAGP
ncbi:MAG: hypothetical protein KM310_11815 [Clostridiales bacterium]|nr:hypothetical protein [Clostridiales bacterium]